MTPSTLRTVGSALYDKARGEELGRVRALVAAAAAGVTTAALTYRVLRAGSD
jgi:hypothetical protein